MIDEATYNTLKRFIEPCQGYDKLLSEVGYIEVVSFSPMVCEITSSGKLALREYEMYAERNRIEDARHRDEYNRSIRIQKAAAYVAVIGVAIAIISIVLSALQII